MSDLDLLELDIAASFTMSADGRIEAARPHPPGPKRDSEADAAISPGPRLYLAGCARGNLARIGAAVDDGVAGRVLAAVRDEPPWSDADTVPLCVAELAGLLSPHAPPDLNGPELVHPLPNGLSFEHPAVIAQADTAPGEALLAGFERNGMPPSLAEAGFLAPADLWWPWCAALEDGEIAALAFAARLTEASAEIGVFTFPRFRGRGFAAAATAAWSRLPSLEGRALIYGCRAANASSRRVAARLGLRPIGARLRIA